MTRRILLVTGSRALADSPRAKRWALARLHEQVAWFLDGEAALLMHGGCFDGRRADPANNPDWWAHHLALLSGVNVEVYDADGSFELFVPDDEESTSGRITTRSRWCAVGERPSPLDRNAHMAKVAAERAKTVEVRVVGLVAPWTRTHGANHTLSRAAELGLDAREIDCPRGYGP